MNRVAVAMALVAGVGAVGTARADVSWEHKGTIRVGSLPMSLINLKMYTNYNTDRSRLLVKYTAPLAPSFPVPAESWKGSGLPDNIRPKRITNYGSFGIVQRLDDDRFIAYESQTGAYVNEGLTDTFRHLIGEPWKNSEPALDSEEIPDLSDAQRRRLGRELRAYFSPATKRFTRTFFRTLSEKRSFNGIDGRGFRMTQVFFVPKSMGGDPSQQLKVAFEWWLAGELPGDDVIAAAQIRAMDKLKPLGYPSKSLWEREAPRVMLYALPEATISALRTLAPGPNFSGFGGTPLELNMTVTPPTASGVGTDLRAQVVLVQRNNDALPARVWDAPENYKKVDMAPLWKKYDEMKSKGTLEQVFEEIEKQQKNRSEDADMDEY
ncbi:MAG TPA: hypothetical protein VF681_14555 [Abditibacteriaceae bacterium]|jgi:hypothetical protein